MNKTFYDQYSYPDGLEGRKIFWKNRITKYFGSCLKGKKLLDVGCGTGTFSKIFLDLGANVHAIDLSQKSVQEVIKNYPKVNAKTGSALDLPYKDKSFDIVTSLGVLHHTGNTEKGFKECERVCKRGGRLFVLLYTKWHPYPIIYNIAKILNRGKYPESTSEFFICLVRKLVGSYYKEPITRERAISLIADQFYTPIAHFTSEWTVKKWCKDLGLQLERTDTTFFGEHKIYIIRK